VGDHPGLPGSFPSHAQKKSLRAAEKNRPEMKTERVAWWEEFAAIDPSRLMFLDESGATTAMTRRLSTFASSKVSKTSRSNNSLQDPSDAQWPVILGALYWLGFRPRATRQPSSDGRPGHSSHGSLQPDRGHRSRGMPRRPNVSLLARPARRPTSIAT
jgi:hypothetical protein